MDQEEDGGVNAFHACVASGHLVVTQYLAPKMEGHLFDTDKYTSGEVQNEMIKVMSFQILRKLASALQNTAYYTIMIDETTDVSTQEQVVVCFRWVSDDFEVHEDFLGMYGMWWIQSMPNHC